MNSIEKEKTIHSIKQRKIEEEKYQDELEDEALRNPENVGHDTDEWFDYSGRDY